MIASRHGIQRRYIMRRKNRRSSAIQRKQKFEKPVDDEYIKKSQQVFSKIDTMNVKLFRILAIFSLFLGFLISNFTNLETAFSRSGGVVICIGLYFLFIHLDWNKFSKEMYKISLDMFTCIEREAHGEDYRRNTSETTPEEVAKKRVDRILPYIIDSETTRIARNEGFILLIGTIVNVFGDIPVNYVRLLLERYVIHGSPIF
jgi:hypothetical protein